MAYSLHVDYKKGEIKNAFYKLYIEQIKPNKQ